MNGLLRDGSLPTTPSLVLACLNELESENPALETQLIVSTVKGMTCCEIDPDDTAEFNTVQMSRLSDLWPSVLKRRPVQYQLGFTIVKGLQIMLSNATLCPGREIEVLIDVVASVLGSLDAGITVDLCTGSGVIAVVLAHKFTEWTFFGTDLSQPALDVALLNRAKYQLENLYLLHGDMLNPLAQANLYQKVDVLVANPPYCKTDDIENLPSQIKEHAPRQAIDGGKDGLAYFRHIARGSSAFLRNDGIIVLEHGVGQVDDIIHLFSKNYDVLSSVNNHAGVPRVLMMQRRSV